MPTYLLSKLRAGLNLIPTCDDYRELINYAASQTGREKYSLFVNQGFATYAQWAEFLTQIG